MALARQNAAHSRNEDSRRRILDASVEVIAQKGFARARVSDIARMAGVSHGLVLYHFGSLEGLLTDALIDSESRFYAVADQLATGPTSGLTRVRELVDWVFTEESRRTHAWILWLETWVQASRLDRVAAARSQQDERWRALFRRALADSFPDSPAELEVAILTLTSLLDGLIVQVALEDGIVSVDRARDLAVRYVQLVIPP